MPTVQPSTQPTAVPSTQPSAQPSQQPSTQPSEQPSSVPSSQPSAQPSSQPSDQPSSQPSSQPSCQPSAQPSIQPTSQPSAQPSRQPSAQPSRQPSGQPSSQPSRQPSRQPTAQPSRQPSAQPSRQPSAQPSRQPSSQPSRQPTAQPTRQPSAQPSRQPSSQPTAQPSRQPSMQPSGQPSAQPSTQPSSQPSGLPSSQPTMQPSTQPSAQPSLQPSAQPSVQPSSVPSAQPSSQPSAQPTVQPSSLPSSQPTLQPSVQPSSQPSMQPSSQPSTQPTAQPSTQPSVQPSSQPTTQPSGQPSVQPSAQPSCQPTSLPTCQPTSQPTVQPSGQPTSSPSAQPSRQPSAQPSSQPSSQPSGQPSAQPSSQPSMQPSAQPSGQPTMQPTGQPSMQPSSQPTVQPSRQPSTQPTTQPSAQPSGVPSGQPTTQPSLQPSSQPSAQPSAQPSSQPSGQPTMQPSSQPTFQPSNQPTSQPTRQPSTQPSGQPSSQPSSQPTMQPSMQPSCQPSGQPSSQPTTQPSSQPSNQPSGQPSRQPSGQPSAQPSTQPSVQPSSQPTGVPSAQPSMQPTGVPSGQPSMQPTMQPSTQPTLQPTSQPSRQPSGQPSSQPSMQPSIQPSGQPSAQPSTQPSSSPSGQPSRQPSMQPSVQPSSLPTVQPSAQPSSVPSGQPSSQPSRQPSSQPSGFPSSQPSCQPSCQPSSQPTNPTSQPTEQPSGQPSSQPTIQPSRQPSSQPSRQPSGQPSRQPSRQPSSQPSSSPSTQPSSQPTVRPTSSRPTGVPSGAPSKYPTTSAPTRPGATNKPSARPTSQPSWNLGDYESQASYQAYLRTHREYLNTSQSFTFGNYYYKGQTVEGQCSKWISMIDDSLTLPFSDLYISSISTSFELEDYPRGVRTQYTATCHDQDVIASLIANMRGRNNFQVNCNQRSWRTYTCDNYPIICVNCKEKCVKTVTCPGTSYTVNPCYSDCTTRIGAGANINFQYSLLILYPVISNLRSIDRTKTSITVQLAASLPGTVYCAAFSPLAQVPSVLSIRSNGVSAYRTVADSAITLTLSNLNADSEYSIYCYSEDFTNHVMPLKEALQTKITVSTTCCKEIQLTTAHGSVVQYFITTLPADENKFVLQLNAKPRSSVRVLLSVVPTICAGGTTAVTATDAVTMPARFSYFANSTSLVGLFVLRATVPGCYRITAQSSGTESYTGFSTTVTVRNFRLAVDPPTLQSVVYSNEGTSLVATFSDNTNQGETVIENYFSTFNCALIVTFTNVNSATCRWLSATQLAITGNALNVLPIVGSTVTLLGNVVRARCPSSTDCSLYLFSSSVSVTVAAPVSAAAPVVSLLAASAIGSCDSIVLDPQSSTGFGTRSWVSVVWSVASNGHVKNNTDIAAHLNTNFPSTAAVATVPNRLLTPGRKYTFSLTLTNFLLQSSISSVQVTVSNKGIAMPQLRIIGPSATSYRWKDVNLFASSVFPACVGNTNIVTTYLWKVYAERDYDASLVTTSKDARYFKLNPYTLVPGTVYTFQVTATATYAGISYSASTAYTLAIGVSGVTAVIEGSSQVTSVVSRAVTFDASSSFDVDYPTGSVLSYAWACSTIAPTFGTSCSNLIPSRSLSSITLAANTLAAGTFNFSVTVSNALGASSLASVQLTTTTKVVPAVSIDTPAVKYNADSKVILTASVISTGSVAKATWSCDSLPKLSKIASTNVQKTVTAVAPTFQLALSPYTLTPGVTYTFALSANYVSSSDFGIASVTIVINAPPANGVVTSVPATGTALTTTYLITTSLWVDDASDLPLNYVLSYYTLNMAQLITLKSSDQLPSVSTVLGQGLQSLSYRVTLLASATDVFLASANATTTVFVLPVATTQALSTSTTASLAAAQNDKNPTAVNQIVSAAVQTINMVDCSVSTACATLNRVACKSTARTCGTCLPSFIGVFGDSNTPCLVANASIPIGGLCASNSVCISGVCSAGKCIDKAKSCPNACSGQGTCLFYDSDNTAISFCSVFNPLCSASCTCASGFYGNDCSMVQTKLELLQAFRESLCRSMYASLAQQDVSLDVMNSRAVTVAELVLDMTQVNDNAFLYCTSVMVDTVVARPDLACVGSAATLISTALSNILQRATTSNVASALFANISSAVGAVAANCQIRLAIGETPVSIVTDNLRISSVVTSRDDLVNNYTLSVAQSPLELLGGIPAASTTVLAKSLSNNEALGLSLVQYNNNPLGAQTNATALTVRTATYSTTAQDGTRRRLAFDNNKGGKYITLQNKQPMSYLSFYPTEIQIKCITPLDDASYPISGVCPSGYPYTVECPARVKGFVNITCEGRTTRPQCTKLVDSVFVEDTTCEVVSFTSTTTVCRCQDPTTASGLRRLQQQSFNSEGTYATTLLVQTAPFSAQFVPFPLLAVPTLDHAVTYSVYGLSGIFVALLLGLVVWETRQHLGKSKKKIGIDSGRPRGTSRTIVTFFLSILPDTFKSGTESWRVLLPVSLLEHHTWLRVYYHTLPDSAALPSPAAGGGALAVQPGVEKSIQYWIIAMGKLFTVLFFNSLLAHLAYPYDASCADITSPDVCEDQLTFTEMHQSCAWSEESQSCGYRSPGIGIFDTIFYTALVLAASIIYNAGLDFVLARAFAAFTDRKMRLQLRDITRQASFGFGDSSKGADAPVNFASSKYKVADQKIFRTMDEFQEFDCTRLNMMRAARLAKSYKVIHGSTAWEESTFLFEQLHAKAEKETVPVRNFLLNYDLPHEPTVYENLVAAAEREHREKLVIDRVQNTRNTASKLFEQVFALPTHAQKEAFLLQRYLVDTMPGDIQHIVQHVFDEASPPPPPASTTRGKWISDTITAACLLLSVAHFGLITFGTIVFDRSVVSTNMSLWVLVLFLSIIEYFVLIEVLSILIRDVVVVQQLVGKRVEERWRVLMTRARLILMRRYGLMRDAHALVQHLNPACRVARSFPFLPVSRLLISINDKDLTKLYLPHKPTWTEYFGTLLHDAPLLLFAYVPYSVGVLLCNLISLIFFSAWIFGLYFLGRFNLIAGIVVACGVLLLPLIREVFLYYYRKRVRQTKIYVEKENFEEFFYDPHHESVKIKPEFSVQGGVSMRSGKVLIGINESDKEEEDDDSFMDNKVGQSTKSARFAEKLKSSKHFGSSTKFGTSTKIGVSTKFGASSKLPSQSIKLNGSMKASGSVKGSPYDINNSLMSPSVASKRILGPPISAKFGALQGSVVEDDTDQLMKEKYNAVFGGPSKGRANSIYLPPLTATGGAAAFIAAQQQQDQQMEQQRQQRQQNDVSTPTRRMQRDPSQNLTHASSISSNFSFGAQDNTGNFEEAKTPQNDLGNVGIAAGTGIVTFNQGSWYMPQEGEDDTGPEELRVKFDEVSLAEPSVGSWDGASFAADNMSEKSFSTYASRSKKRVMAFASKISNVLHRVKGSPTAETRKRHQRSKHASSSEMLDTMGDADRPDNASRPIALLPRQPARSASPTGRGRMAPTSNPLATAGDGRSASAQPRMPMQSGPQRGPAHVVDAVMAANRLQRMNRFNSENFQSIRKRRQISRGAAASLSPRRAQEPALSLDTDSKGQGPGANLIGENFTGPGVTVGTFSPTKYSTISQSKATVGTPTRDTKPDNELAEPGSPFASYLLISPDDQLPVVDILANLEPAPPASSIAQVNYNMLGQQEGTLRPRPAGRVVYGSHHASSVRHAPEGVSGTRPMPIVSDINQPVTPMNQQNLHGLRQPRAREQNARMQSVDKKVRAVSKLQKMAHRRNLSNGSRENLQASHQSSDKRATSASRKRES